MSISPALLGIAPAYGLPMVHMAGPSPCQARGELVAAYVV